MLFCSLCPLLLKCYSLFFFFIDLPLRVSPQAHTKTHLRTHSHMSTHACTRWSLAHKCFLLSLLCSLQGDSGRDGFCPAAAAHTPGVSLFFTFYFSSLCVNSCFRLLNFDCLFLWECEAHDACPATTVIFSLSRWASSCNARCCCERKKNRMMVGGGAVVRWARLRGMSMRVRLRKTP